MTFGVGCILEDCARDHHSRGFCRTHYRRYVNEGKLWTQPGRNQRYHYTSRGCDYEGCERPHKAKGYCHPHYNRARLGKPMECRANTPWEVIEDYLECGYSAPLIAQRLKIGELAIQRQCEHNERMDLWRRATVRVA